MLRIIDNYSLLPPAYFSCYIFKPIYCNPPSINEPTPAQIEHTFWRPSDALLKVLRILHEIDYTQFPCIPCRAHTAHICYTLIRSSGSLAKQIPSSYLNQVYPHIPLNTHPRNSIKVAVCPHVNYHLTH